MPHLIVVGSGIAGLTASLTAAQAGADVTLVTKAELSASNTAHAQGGIAAALTADDSPALHAADTLAVGGGLGDPDAVAVLCAEGPARVRELISAGVAFDRDGDDLARGLEAAHSRSRVLHAGGDATGAAIEAALVAAVRHATEPGPASGRGSVTVREHTMLIDLVVEDGRAVGVELLGGRDSGGRGSDGRGSDGRGSDGRGTAPRPEVLHGDAVLLATGGAGRLYSHTTNPAIATGDGVAAAWRAGAALTDLEFYQFHPTTLVAGGFLVSEAVRGDGAVLVDSSGERFMTAVHPDAELAPRDVVARGIAERMAARPGESVYLDATALGAAFLARRFPTIDRACREAGLDWAREPVAVTPAAHYWMGGIATDLRGRTGLPGLYAAGEAACTGVHGANRLASNSLLEGAVFGFRAAVDVVSDGHDGAAGGSAGEHRATGTPGTAPSGVAAHEPGALSTGDLAQGTLASGARSAIQELMWQGAGVVRSGAGLAATADRLLELARADTRPGARPGAHDGGPDCGPDGGPDDARAEPEPRPDAVRAVEDRNLLQLALLVVDAAAERRESRGAHARVDFPTASDTARHLIRMRSDTPAREAALTC